LEKIEIQNEKKDLLAQIDALNLILEDTVKELRKRLTTLVATYGDERKTEITHIAETNKEEKEIEFVEPEKCVVVMTKSGLIKRIPASSFRTQKRNGKGVKTADDIVNAVIRTNTIDSLMIFTNKGKMYRLLVNDIPVGTNTTKGQTVRSLINMEPNEDPAVMYSIYRDTEAKYVMFVSKNGLVKKTTLDEYTKTKKKSGIGAINIKEDDELAAVTLINDEDIVLITENGMGIRFKSSDIPVSSRMTTGVKGINIAENDIVVAALPVRDVEDSVAVFSKSGLSKKFALKELPVQKRAGKGLICYKEPVASAVLVSDEDNVLLIGDTNSICISASDIPLMGRAAAGNQMIKNSKIVSVSKV
jgi:DNA gyrase subunit A